MINQKKDMIFATALVRRRLNLPLRNAKPVQKKDVAKEAGISDASYSLAENGIIPGEKVLTRIARYFNVPEETLLNPPDEEVPIYKGIEEGGHQSQDKEGLFGKTRHLELDGAGFTVTTHEPTTSHDPFRQASKDLLEIYNYGDPGIITAIQANLTTFRRTVRREQQVTQQAEEIKELKAECEAFREKNNDLEKRIAALEEKLLSENNPREEPAGEPGERKVA